MADSILVKHRVTGSRCRLLKADYEKQVADAEELGVECPFVVEDDQNPPGLDAPTFDDLDEEGKAAALEAQKERAERLKK